MVRKRTVIDPRESARMTLKERINADLTAAMKAKDAERLGVVRMLKARLLEAEVELRATRGTDYQLADPEAIGVIASYAKQRRDSIDAYRNAGRADLAAKEEVELGLITQYLPAQLSEEEIRTLVREAIAAAGASSAKDMGSVMKALMPKVKGAADGALVNRIVRELLG